ncbi:hypothetical protein COU53_01605 [Candidatus Pacearchaeota archaeon CG10_big_fil_rev_8_21_14_0_10_30_48]|nr:MAG: hypothetical protein COU53_01605 [Candidatus Pacearchaeota archaeon CG10_big_fil_rev_8_21_14_0_10_30_48]
MNNKTGSLFVLIAAIFNYIGAGLIILGSLIIFLLGEVPKVLVNEGLTFSVRTITLLGIALGILVLILAFLQQTISKKMKNKKMLKNNSILAIILGIITVGNISGILCLIGGIIGLSESKK